MFFTYKIFYQGSYVGKVNALSENSAITKAYMLLGSPSAFSGGARSNFTAKKG